MSRWPSWVYDVGDEPDYRFSLANERTMLAWLRTALGLVAAGVAADAVELQLPTSVQQTLAVLLVSLGLVSAAFAWIRWARAERAMRNHEALPSAPMGLMLAASLVVAAGAVLITILATL